MKASVRERVPRVTCARMVHAIYANVGNGPMPCCALFMSDLWACASGLHLRAGRCRWAELQLVCRAERGTNVQEVEQEQVVPASCGE